MKEISRRIERKVMEGRREGMEKIWKRGNGKRRKGWGKKMEKGQRRGT